MRVDRRDGERGQTIVEAAILLLAFVMVFLGFIQLALLAVHKHELNHLAFQTARLWSIKSTDSSTPGPRNPTVQALGVHVMARKNKFAYYTAITTTTSIDGNNFKMESWIPLMIPGGAQVITGETDWAVSGGAAANFLSSLGINPGSIFPPWLINAARTVLNFDPSSWIAQGANVLLDVPTRRAIKATILIPMKRELPLNQMTPPPWKSSGGHYCEGDSRFTCFDNDSL